ncbi:MAG: T9SS type A sorting domain-containing protein [bacterium]|nr:T9SS type A sorting domain-containing protein [bacterium]
MRAWVFFMILVVAFSAMATTLTTNSDRSLQLPAYDRFGNRVIDEINVDTVYNWNFESGEQGWTVVNLTAATPYWHVDYRRAYGGTGLSWYCGDTIRFPLNGGYEDHKLMYLDSPVLNLSGTSNPVLTFRVYVALEAPGGEPTGYNGWDTGNLWYSTNGGTTWAPLPITAAAGATGYLYNITSSYAFGVEFGMGPNIPGWGGSSNGWQQVTVPIPASMRVAQFKLRFAMCSDPAYCTIDDPTLYGMHVDNILLSDGATQILANNAEAISIPSQLVSVSGNPVSPTNWARTQQTTVGHTVPWTMWIDDAPTNFRSALTSPYIYLQPGYTYWWQYNVWCDMPDYVSPGQNTLEDYYRVELKAAHPDSQWRYQHHDYKRTGAGGDGWTTYVPGTPFGSSANIQMDLSPWVGDSIQLRFVAIGDTDNSNGNGAGLYVDDIMILRTDQPNNDLATSNLLVPYPTTVGYTTKGTVKVSNVGRNAQSSVILRWRRSGQVTSINIGDLPAGEDTTVLLRTGTTGQAARGWTPTAAGPVVVDAYTVLTGDENPANDTTNFYNATLNRTDTVLVRPANTYELGYDARRIEYMYIFQMGEGPMVKFTPIADSLPPSTGGWNLSTIRVQWNGNMGTETRTIRLKIFADNNGEVGNLLHTQDVTVQAANTLPNWHDIQLTYTINVTGDFYVWFERIDATSQLPNIIGHDNVGAFIPGHGFSYNGTTRIAQNRSYRLHAILTPVTDVRENVDITLPSEFALYPAYPNPFNPSTEIRFAVPTTSDVKLAVYDVNGREIVTLVNQRLSAGFHSVSFNGSHLSSGMYLIRMNSGNFQAVQKVLLIK